MTITHALIARRGDDKTQTVAFEDIPLADLPAGEVLVRVSHSALNYKDALAITGRAPIVRQWPMVLGIDLAGEVVESASAGFAPGDKVLVNGWGLSETRWGGYSQYQRLPADLVQKIPAGLTAEQAMQIGTAGYTAMLCVMALQDHGVAPDQGPVLVTGASGGVGSIAVVLLSRLGFEVQAVSGRPEQAAYLRELGAAEVLDRAAMSAGGKPMARERWAGCVDAVGGAPLAEVIAQIRSHGTVATCGMAAGGTLPTTVYPFILRGVTLAGVESITCPMARRVTAWDRLAREMPAATLAGLSQTRAFAELPGLADDLLAGRLHGRVAIAIP